MNTKQNPLKRILNTRGMGGALTAFAGLIVIYIAFGIINPTVFSGQNIMNLLRSMSKYLLIGIGQSYILITGNIDLSIGSVADMSAMISATLMTMGVHPIAAILATLACCLVIGVLNGLLVGKWKLPPFIATLGTMFVARGVAYIVNGNRNTDAIASGIGKEAADAFGNFFYYGSTFGIYNTFWIAMALFVVFFFLLSGTRTGRHIYAIGSNVDAAKLSGVSVLATTTKAYLVSAFCSCVVGLILCGRVADPGERPEHDRRPGGHPAAGHRHHRGGRRVPGRGRPQRHPEKARQGRLSQRKLDTVRC
jgi:ribose transport system permease protein